ncbi:hypothetical protein Tco_0936302 [Tanacetum coccineum]
MTVGRPWLIIQQAKKEDICDHSLGLYSLVLVVHPSVRYKEEIQRNRKAKITQCIVIIDEKGFELISHNQRRRIYALMACNSSGSDTEVISCSKECKESYAELKKLYDEQRAQLSDASIEIQAYTQALKKVEAQLVAHQQSQLLYKEKIRFMKIDLDDKLMFLHYIHKKLTWQKAEKAKKT